MNNNISSANELMKILEKENLTEIAYEEDGVKILLKRDYKFDKASAPVAKESPTKTPKVKKENMLEILSHRIGIFYPHKKNDDSILVPGFFIKEGDEIGYILTMGVKNPVISDFSGTIAEVLVEEGEIVDFTKPILRLKK